MASSINNKQELASLKMKIHYQGSIYNKKNWSVLVEEAVLFDLRPVLRNGGVSWGHGNNVSYLTHRSTTIGFSSKNFFMNVFALHLSDTYLVLRHYTSWRLYSYLWYSLGVFRGARKVHLTIVCRQHRRGYCETQHDDVTGPRLKHLTSHWENLHT